MINYLRWRWGSLTGAVLAGPLFMNQQPPPPPPDQPPYGGQPPYGQQPPYPGGYAQIPNYLPWAIVITVVSVFCCPGSVFSFVFGVIAIVKAAGANNKRAMGNMDGAMEDANAARTWTIVAAVLLLIGLVINFVISWIWGGAMEGWMQRQRTNPPTRRI